MYDTPTMEAVNFAYQPKRFASGIGWYFRGPHHPTHAQAAIRMKYHSHRDLREMQRIARLLPDEQVLRRPWSPRYSKLWKRWLDNKGPDIVIVFE
ncbi:hypothetical protein F4604DRAFT_962364 [Suillus subluteus]|nr:hypothetical protein F4604DRAFT_962364 [Suillus subluteus]